MRRVIRRLVFSPLLLLGALLFSVGLAAIFAYERLARHDVTVDVATLLLPTPSENMQA